VNASQTNRNTECKETFFFVYRVTRVFTPRGDLWKSEKIEGVRIICMQSFCYMLLCYIRML